MSFASVSKYGVLVANLVSFGVIDVRRNMGLCRRELDTYIGFVALNDSL